MGQHAKRHRDTVCIEADRLGNGARRLGWPTVLVKNRAVADALRRRRR
jgi:hypothetical protein